MNRRGMHKYVEQYNDVIYERGITDYEQRRTILEGVAISIMMLNLKRHSIEITDDVVTIVEVLCRTMVDDVLSD